MQPYEVTIKRDGCEAEGSARRWCAYAKVASVGERRGYGRTPEEALAAVSR